MHFTVCFFLKISFFCFSSFLFTIYFLSLHPHFEKIIFIIKHCFSMFQNQYETVFILTPVLSEIQIKEAVDKFKKTLTDLGAEIVHEEHWGLRKLAYAIQNKNTGYYQLIQFKAAPTTVATLETDYKRDERVMRYLTTKLDKYAIDYSDRRSKGQIGRKNVETAPKEAETEN